MKVSSSLSLLWASATAAAVLDPQFVIGGQTPLRENDIATAKKPSSEESQTTPPAYRNALLSLHKTLIETKSVTGTESDVGDVLVEYLTKHNFTAVKQYVKSHERTPPGGKRFNIIAWPGGSSSDSNSGSIASLDDIPHRKLLLSSHIDVVPPHIPYGIDAPPDEVTGSTVICGRGSVDAKGSVATQVMALEQVLAGSYGGALAAKAAAESMLLYVVGEEEGGDGMAAFSDWAKETGAGRRSHRHDGAGVFGSVIFGEPTENKLACGHKGMLGCHVTAKGQAGHSGYPWLGKSANEVLLRGLLAVVDADLDDPKAPIRFGNTTVNIGLMDGGVAANVIPAAAAAQLAIRVATGPQSSGQEAVRDRLLAALASVDADALHAECTGGYGFVDCNCDVEGFDTITVNYGTDVPNLVGNHTRYLYGPGNILVAHSDHEALPVSDLEKAVEDYQKLIVHILSE